MMPLRGVVIGLLWSLVFWFFLGACGYIGYKWAIADAKQLHELVKK